MESFEEAWEFICDYCKERISKVAFQTWIERVKPVDIDFDKGKATLLVQNNFHRKTIEKCFTSLFEDAIAEIFGPGIKIEIIVPEEKDASLNTKSESTPSSNFFEYTFENFIVGSSNKFAHAAALAVASHPAGAYNPLFIYGNSGLGKTHIISAISNQVKKTNPKFKTAYVKGDDFTIELIDSIKNGTTAQFRQKYRETDLLLVDDIQFIAGKDSTQEEFFHTFNALYENKKQIVLTSDRPPKEIKTLEDRLRTRFEWGLIADIQPPDYETRIAIVQRKAELVGVNIPEEVCEYIAQKLTTNIRQLEGIVKNLKADLLLKNIKPNLANAQSNISKILNNDNPPEITVEKIIEEVARTFEVSSEEILSSKRSANISLARQITIYVIREITQMPLVNIGQQVGNRDHSTVVYAIKKAEETIKKRPSIASMVEDIIKNVRDA